MTAKEFKNKMMVIRANEDTEVRHADADQLMCELLSELGYEEGVDIFKGFDKWYA